MLYFPNVSTRVVFSVPEIMKNEISGTRFNLQSMPITKYFIRIFFCLT